MTWRLKIPRAAAVAARELRVQRRTRLGKRWRPWPEIADELERQGHGRHDPRELADAVSALPVESHALAPLADVERNALEVSWMLGWAEEFPGEPWPGLAEAQERIRQKNLKGVTRT